MPAERGKFIALEGIDGSGTTTQAAMLSEHLQSHGLTGWLTREPTDTPIGHFIREELSGTGPGRDEASTPSETALCLLFAADRIEHSGVIEKTRSSGKHVVCDRYVMSSIAYQSRNPDISAERVIEVNRGCAVPDITLFLDVSVGECLRRLQARGDSRTIYEKADLLEAIDRNYRMVGPAYEQHFGRLTMIDGSRTPQQVHEDITSHLARHLKL